MNSLTFLFSFVLFLAFGYVSLIRILYKDQFQNELRLSDFITKQNCRNTFDSMPETLLFSGLPVISLGLFFGWAPAILWLLIHHLIIESTYNFQLSQYLNRSKAVPLVDELFLKSNSAKRIIVYCLFSLALIILASSTIVFVSYFVGNIAASSSALIRDIAWTPFAPVAPWLSLNSQTLVASLLIIALLPVTVFNAAKSNNIFSRFSQNCHKAFNTASAICIVAFIVMAILMLVFSIAPIQTPIQNKVSSSIHTPAFLGICMLLFTTMSCHILRTLFMGPADMDEPEALAKHKNAADYFIRLQSLSLVTTIIYLAIFISLMTMLGLGAWRLHYLNWPASIDLSEHLKLITVNFLSMLKFNSLAVIVLIAISIVGINFLLFCSRLIVELGRIFELPKYSVYLLYSIIFFSSLYLIDDGIRIELWYIFAVINWTIFSFALCSMVLSNADPINNTKRHFYLICLIIVLAGFVQALYLVYYFSSQNNLLYMGIYFSLLCVACFILLEPCKAVFKLFIAKNQTMLF